MKLYYLLSFWFSSLISFNLFCLSQQTEGPGGQNVLLNFQVQKSKGQAICTSGDTPNRIENMDSNRYLYTHTHSSIINNSQTVEAAQVSTDG